MKYNRTNPSPEFQRYIDMYESMHSSGHTRDLWEKEEADFNPEDCQEQMDGSDTFIGEELIKIKPIIKKLINITGAKDMMDYGCGKAAYYTQVDPADNTTIPQYLGIPLENIFLYEPAIPELARFPLKGRLDIVVCNDVIEHIPVPDVYWVLEELFEKANEAVLVRISCVLAKSILPDGTNAHCTIKSPEYWLGLVTLLCHKYDVSAVLDTTSYSEKEPGRFDVITKAVIMGRHNK